jgi:flagellar biosynthesis/type III secretory pathway protein FliH
MDNHASQDKQKFFFDLNIFDEKEEPDEPPPPMFTEAELETVRQKAFAEGQAQAAKEQMESREQHISKVLDKIAQDTSILFAAESTREKTYEYESVRLCLAAFQKAFPLYIEKFGVEDLKRSLESILQRQEGQKQIIIHVAPDDVEGIQQHVARLKARGLDLHFSVQGDPALPVGGSRLSWSDGGAVRNPDILAKEIEYALKELLAGAVPKVHDS